MAGYTRTDTANEIANGNVVDADLFDAEYNAIEGAFNATTGHSHDGTAAEGSPITKVGPAQDLIISAAKVEAKTSATLDLGSSAVRFKDAYLSGDLDVDGTLDVASNVVIGGNLTVTGAATINGNLTFGDSAADSVAFGADINSSIIPNLNNTYDLGSTTKEWRNLYIDGTANVDTLLALTITAPVINATTFTGNLIGGTAGTHTGPVTGDTTGLHTGNVTGNVTGNTAGVHTGNVTGNVTGNTAGVHTGNVTGNTAGVHTGPTAGVHTGNVTGNASTATKLANARTIDITGDITATAVAFDGSGNIAISASVNDDSHNHITGNIDGLAEYIQDTIGGMVTGNTESGIAVTYVDGDGTLDFNVNDPIITLSGAVTGSGTMTNLGNVSIATTATADPTLTLAGDLSGSATFTNLGNATLTAVVANDSHTHDGRYYTETESNSRFTASAGDVMTGSLRFNDNVLLTLGTGADAELFCNGSHLYMDLNAGIGNFYIRDGSTTRFTFDDAGHFTATGNVTAYSDRRLKSDIVTIPNALDTVSKLRGVNFTKDGKASTGVIAQEVQEVVPEVVHEGEEYLSVAYGNLVGVLIEAVKELKAEVDALKKV